MAFLATRRGIVLVALGVASALVNAKAGVCHGHGFGFGDSGW